MHDRGRIHVALGKPCHGWVQMAIMVSEGLGHEVLHCSDVFCPLADIHLWLRRIERGEPHAAFEINHEGDRTSLTAEAVADDAEAVRLRVVPDRESARPIDTCLRRVDLVAAFAGEIDRWLREDWHPRDYGDAFGWPWRGKAAGAWLRKLDFGVFLRGGLEGPTEAEVLHARGGPTVSRWGDRVRTGPQVPPDGSPVVVEVDSDGRCCLAGPQRGWVDRVAAYGIEVEEVSTVSRLLLAGERSEALAHALREWHADAVACAGAAGPALRAQSRALMHDVDGSTERWLEGLSAEAFERDLRPQVVAWLGSPPDSAVEYEWIAQPPDEAAACRWFDEMSDDDLELLGVGFVRASSCGVGVTAAALADADVDAANRAAEVAGLPVRFVRRP